MREALSESEYRRIVIEQGRAAHDARSTSHGAETASMEELDPFEGGPQTFSGVVKVWTPHSAELITDSGLILFFNTQGHPTVSPGARVTLVARKYRPMYRVTRIA